MTIDVLLWTWLGSAAVLVCVPEHGGFAAARGALRSVAGVIGAAAIAGLFLGSAAALFRAAPWTP